MPIFLTNSNFYCVRCARIKRICPWIIHDFSLAIHTSQLGFLRYWSFRPHLDNLKLLKGYCSMQNIQIESPETFGTTTKVTKARKISIYIESIQSPHAFGQSSIASSFAIRSFTELLVLSQGTFHGKFNGIIVYDLTINCILPLLFTSRL